MTSENAAPRRGRTTWIAVLAAVVALAVVVGLVALLGGGDSDDRGTGPAAGASTSASPSTSSAPAPPSAPGTPEQSPQVLTPPLAAAGQVEGAPPSLEPVGLQDTVRIGEGITAELSSISAMQASADGPGNVAGPALAVTVRITNGTGAPVQLADVEVALSYTAEERSASPVDDDAAAPLAGELAAGRSAEGTYVFSVPVGQRDVVTVTVGLVAGAPLLVFSGAVA